MPADVEIVVPAHDEGRVIEHSVRAIHAALAEGFPYRWHLTIAENASVDDTLARARAVAAELPHTSVLHLPEAGRGRALRWAWLASDAPIRAYMDADLSTDLAHLAALVGAVADGADLAVGSRLAPGAATTRSLGREAISRSYNALVRAALRVPFRDAQCGFKAIGASAADALLPLVRDQGWFFDTELLVLAHRHGLRVDELPVRWVEDPDSSVKIVPTVIADLRGVARLATRGQGFSR